MEITLVTGDLFKHHLKYAVSNFCLHMLCDHFFFLNFSFGFLSTELLYIVTVLIAPGKCALADVTCYCKMTSVRALDGVALFLHLKDNLYSCKHMRQSPTIGGISSVQWRKVGRS